jgi:hypothetical protein
VFCYNHLLGTYTNDRNAGKFQNTIKFGSGRNDLDRTMIVLYISSMPTFSFSSFICTSMILLILHSIYVTLFSRWSTIFSDINLVTTTFDEVH